MSDRTIFVLFIQAIVEWAILSYLEVPRKVNFVAKKEKGVHSVFDNERDGISRI